MASSTLAIPASYHKPTPSIRKSKLDTTNVANEDELLKFFLHGSYDVQRGNRSTTPLANNNDKTVCISDEKATISSLNNDDKQGKSRCMFEETYMINISVKQPDTKPSSKQIDVRIEKTPSDAQITNENVDDDDDEISSIFDEEEEAEENDEVDSAVFNEINALTSETPLTKLTLADMINKTLTTIPPSSSDKLNNNWYNDKESEVKTRKPSNVISPSIKVEKLIKTPSPAPMSAIIRPSTLTTNIAEDEKLFEYLDYLETKEESNQSIQPSNSPKLTKNSKPLQPVGKVLPKEQQQQQLPIPIIDLEQLCRSLTVNDLKDEFIRKKIHELKSLIDERHKKQNSQVPLIKPRRDNLPILIAMPPAHQERRRTTTIQPTTLLQSKTADLQVPYTSTYHGIISHHNHNHKHSPPPALSRNSQQYSQHHISSTTTDTNRKYQLT